MRYLFFLVLLGNIVFYVWEWRADALKLFPVQEKEAEDYALQIVMLSEVPPEQKPQEEQPQTQTQAEEPQEELSDNSSPVLQEPQKELICFEIGPFDDKNQFTTWNEQNSVKAERISFNVKDLEVVSGYMVYYPAAETILQAEENIAILEAKGVRDLWLFKFGNMKGAISLGFHDTEARAKQALKEFEKWGIDTKIMVHSKVKNYTFAKITWNIGEQEASKLIANYKEQFKDQKVEKLMDCSTIKSIKLPGTPSPAEGVESPLQRENG